MSRDWTEAEREAARAFLAEVQPSNPAALVSNIEAFMPPAFRRGFEAAFRALAPASETGTCATCGFVGRVEDHNYRHRFKPVAAGGAP